MSRNTEQEARNKALVLEAFETLFNRRDYPAAERYWSPHYIQHSAHIAPGREGLFDLVRNTPATMRYENALTVADGDYVLLHGRFSGIGQPAAWVVVDIVRLEGGRLAGALGRHPGRSDEGAIQERTTDVRNQLSRLALTRTDHTTPGRRRCR